MHSRVRSLFVSDVHLGTPDCQAGHLLHLLNTTTARRLFLVGDIVDIKAMNSRAYWHPTHTRVLERLLELANSGTRVVYVPGNHDEEARAFCGAEWRGIEIRRELDYVAVDGSRYRVRHGDELDELGQGKRWLESVGETLYGFSCRLNTWYNSARQRMDLTYSPWSVSIKRRLSKAMAYIQCFEERAMNEARGLLVDGYICGHIHFANIRCVDGIAYLNDGDWVEHCTTICELEQGGFELWRCADRSECLATLPSHWWTDSPLSSAA
ncbi:MAG: UDP-2,3-diacylglucosamine diphosphatase [Pseudomonadota bacterium]